MRKRINSQEKYSYAEVKAVALALNTNPPSSKQVAAKHPPRPSKKSQNSKCSLSYLSKGICTQKIKQFPNPLLKELRRLVLNQIDSGDRLFRSLITEQHKAALQLYSQDRLKLIEYLNSLAIRQVNIDNIKLNLQKRSQGKESKNGVLEVPTLDLSAEANETTRKRCKSEFPKDVKSEELKMLKKKLKKIQKDWQQTNNLKLISKDKQVKNIEQSENVLLQVKQLLEDAMKNNTLKQNFVILEKSEIEMIIYLLNQGMNRSEERDIVNSKQIEEIQMQMQQKEEIIAQLSKQLQEKISQIHLIQKQCKEHHSTNYEQLKEKVNNLYNQLSSLVNDAQTKDQLIEYLKSENQTLKTDIQGLQQMNNKAKKQQNALSQYFQSLQERLRYSDDQINRREEQSNQLRVDLLHKDHELATKVKQLKHLLVNIQSLKQQSEQKIGDLQKKLLAMSDQKHLVELEKEFLKSYVVKLENKLKTLEQLIKLLPKTAQNTEHLQIILQNKNDSSQLKTQRHKVKNQLVQRVKQQSKHIINDAEQVLQRDNLQLREADESPTLKLAKSLSLEVNQSYFPENDHHIDFIGINLETPVKNRSLSLNEQNVFVTKKLIKHQESDIYKVTKRPASKNKKIETMTELDDAYQSDDEGQYSSYDRDSKDTIKISSLSKQLKQIQPKQCHNNQSQVSQQKNQNKVSLAKQATSKDLLEIQELEEHEITRNEVEKNDAANPIENLAAFNKLQEQKPKAHSMQNLDQMKKISIVLNQQYQEQANGKTSEVPSKMSQSSSRTIFIKWPAKKLINVPENIQKIKSYGQ